MRRITALCLLGLVAACGEPANPPDSDSGPARRIVTLAPHLAELVYAVGAGEQLVGVSAYSDYPAAVQSLPIVGDALMIDLEQLALLKPDLLLAWESGTPSHVVDEFRTRGYRVALIRTRQLQDIASALRSIGELTGHAGEAARLADSFQNELSVLAADYTDAGAIRVFYQVSSRPLYTVNGSHYASELIELCGGQNIFEDLGELAPMIAEEAVLERDPEVLLAADVDGNDAFSVWARWPLMSANRYDNHFLVPADEIGRPTARLVAAGRAVCQRLQQGREQRAAAQP
ncbi:MAG: helical backbone metal receptor [Woeseia sp.]